MPVVLAHRPMLAVLVSLLAAVAILFSDRRPNLRETWSFLAAAIASALVFSLLPEVLQHGSLEATYIELLPGLALHLRADLFGLIFALLASVLWLVTTLYSIGYMRHGHYDHQTGYFACFAVCVAAAVGIAFSANLLTFFIFYEILTIATYPLVTHDRHDEALSGGRKYLAYTLGAGQILFIAVISISLIAPGASFQPGGFLADRASSGWLTLLFIFAILGISVKAAIMPLHGWLPTAMVAPTPVSALLHAVAVVKAGAFGCIRIVHYVFGIDVLHAMGADTVLALLASATILVASIRALGEQNLKRRLAYSTISQLSYIVLGAAIGTPAALAGAMFHIVAHGFMKITLFFCAGAIYVKTHKVEIPDLDGLGRQMPITFGAFTIGALGLAGTPLCVGFISKWNLGLGALQGDHPLFLIVLVVSGLLNFAYFFPIIYRAFFGHPEQTFAFDEAPVTVSLPLALTAAVSILLGVYPNFGASTYDLAWQAAERVLASAAAAGAAGGF